MINLLLGKKETEQAFFLHGKFIQDIPKTGT